MKRTKLKPGTILKVPIDGDYFTYGRILNFSDIAIYDFRSDKELELQQIISGNILFKVRVYYDDLKWDKVGIIPLEPALQHSKYWIDEVAHPDKCKLFIDDDIKFKVPASEAEGVEYGGIWRPEDIITRIIDHFNGKPNRKFVVPGQIERELFEAAANRPQPSEELIQAATLAKSKGNFLLKNGVKDARLKDLRLISVEGLIGTDESVAILNRELDEYLIRYNLMEAFNEGKFDDQEIDEVSQGEKIKFLSVVSNFIEKPLSIDPILSSMVPIIRQSIQDGHKEEIDSLYEDLREMLGDMPTDIKRNINKELRAAGVSKI